jgi:hypothetical protein
VVLVPVFSGSTAIFLRVFGGRLVVGVVGSVTGGGLRSLGYGCGVTVGGLFRLLLGVACTVVHSFIQVCLDIF